MKSTISPFILNTEAAFIVHGPCAFRVNKLHNIWFEIDICKNEITLRNHQLHKGEDIWGISSLNWNNKIQINPTRNKNGNYSTFFGPIEHKA